MCQKKHLWNIIVLFSDHFVIVLHGKSINFKVVSIFDFCCHKTTQRPVIELVTTFTRIGYIVDFIPFSLKEQCNCEEIWGLLLSDLHFIQSTHQTNFFTPACVLYTATNHLKQHKKETGN